MHAIVLALALLGASPAAAVDQSLPAIDRIVARKLGQEAPGIAVLVMRSGKVVHMRGYGHANVQDKIAVNADTVFDLASVSKQMTALGAALLIADGSLSLDSEIGEVLPDFASDGVERAITVSDLIHHVAALPDYLNAEEVEFTATSSNAEVVDWLAGMPLTGPPGLRYEYSNSAYLLLASTIAAAAGTPDLRSFLRQRVWQPLGMSSTSIATPAAGVKRPQIARGYKGEDGQFELSEEPSQVQGDGSVLTTLRDLARYEQALVEHRLLDAAHTSMLFQNGEFDNGNPIDDGEGSGYGFGWSLGDWNGSRYATHSGSWMGTATYYLRNLDSGVSVIVLANGEDLDAEELASAVEAAL
ncbi:MAG TPA: serine hydrolase domain-containing protein [Xanthomonadales bacterium]|nr:serine hydrolase domain-containing protein [Xanthomonadales bacterium]